MIEISPKNAVKKSLYSFLLIGVSKDTTKVELLSYLSDITHVMGVCFLDAETVEIVVMRLSDCKNLIQSPLYLKGCKIQVIPFLYLGRKVNHSMTQSGNNLSFEYCSRTISASRLIEYV